jgi:hypothetical protein
MENFETGIKKDAPAEEKKKEGTSSEKKIGKIDEIFDELLDKVKDAPEAEQEALKILIQQLKQIGEQMKQVRDMKHLQEVKKLMMEHWKELEKLAGGDPNLLKTIQDWGKKFVEEKVIYCELVENVKDELIDKSQEVQEAHDDLMIDLGEVCGLLEHKGYTIMSLDINQSDEAFVFKTGLERFIKNLSELRTGFDDNDLFLEEANRFLENMNGVILKLSRASQDKTHNDPLNNPNERYIDKYPQIKEILERIKGKKGILSKNIKDASKIFKVVKKIHDTHFLPLYNEQPEQIVA